MATLLEGDWEALIEETSRALAVLDPEALEALAARAEVLARGGGRSAWSLAADSAQPQLRSRQRLLGQLLDETQRNIAVLRRLSDVRTESTWGR